MAEEYAPIGKVNISNKDEDHPSYTPYVTSKGGERVLWADSHSFDSYDEAQEEADDRAETFHMFEFKEFDPGNAEELVALKKFSEEAEQYCDDWLHGATVIRESYFTEYCKEFVEDVGDMPKKLPSYMVIDWQKTADNLREDYTEIDFDGVTYLVR